MFEEKGVRMWKAYKVGEGCFLPSTHFQGKQQNINVLKIIQPFGAHQKQPGIVRSTGATSDSGKIFGCNENNCILTFSTEKEAQAHMDTGDHMTELESMSVYHTIRKKWAKSITGISNRPSNRAVQQPPGQHTQAEASIQKGWALKTTKERRRFEEKVKEFFIKTFEKGERTGNKPDPSSVAKEMKTKMDNSGKPYFEPSEWKTSQQIKSFFSRFNTKMKQLKTGTVLATEDIQAWEAEVARQHLRQNVHNKIVQPQQPIEVLRVNICLYVHQGKLASLKLPKLRSICEALGMKGVPSQKETFHPCPGRTCKELWLR